MNRVFMHEVQGHETEAQLKQMYLDYVRDVVRANRHRFLDPGVQKRWWHWKLEYPKVLL